MHTWQGCCCCCACYCLLPFLSLCKVLEFAKWKTSILKKDVAADEIAVVRDGEERGASIDLCDGHVMMDACILLAHLLRSSFALICEGEFSETSGSNRDSL